MERSVTVEGGYYRVIALGSEWTIILYLTTCIVRYRTKGARGFL